MKNICLLFLLFLAACYEPREGCLDIEAVNFDAAADKDCCCQYPALQFEVLQRFDTLVWKPDTAYEYATGQWFRLKSAVFYLSDFQMVRGGTALPVSDSTAFQTWGAAGDTVARTLTDDFLLVRRTATAYTAGSFRTAGLFDAIRFRLGIPDAAINVIPSLAPENHPLRLQAENLWLGRDTGYVAMKLVLTRDTFGTTVPDTLLFSRPDFGNLLLDQPGSFTHDGGYNFKLTLKVDYRELFRDVDLSGGDISGWKQKIVANLPKTFHVSQ